MGAQVAMPVNDKWSAKVAADELIVCLCLQQARTVDIPMMAAACGFDAIYVDLEHTATSLESASMLCSAAVTSGLISMVRVPSHDCSYMTRALDGGAMGILVPHVESESQARQIVTSCRFPPLGQRSISGPNAVTGFRQMGAVDTIEYLNRKTILAVMIESARGVEAAAEIAAVDGIDMLLIGSYDLTAEMKIMGNFDDERFMNAVRTTADACRTQGKVMGIAGIRDIEKLAQLVSIGVRFVSAGTDSGFFTQAASEHVRRIRKVVRE